MRLSVIGNSAILLKRDKINVPIASIIYTNILFEIESFRANPNLYAMTAKIKFNTKKMLNVFSVP